MKKILRYIRQTPTIFGMLIAILVGISIIGYRAIGKFQFLELAMYDNYIRFQPQISKLDPRICIITISETDIQKQGTWPIPDATVAQLLEILLKHKPRVIGLDMYRDLPVPPGSEKLTAIFADNPPIVTVKKLGDEKTPGINQPYMVKDTSLVGSNDILVDPEGVVRRGLLFLDDGKKVYYTFPLLMALLYLKDEGILPQPDEFLRLGKTTFVPLEPNDGGYVGIDARGYQFLLDFSGTKISFFTISMSDALSGQIKPEYIQDKIILIGSTAESLKDFFFIPIYRNNESEQIIAGVELHASIVSQILHCALDDRKPMRFIRESYEWMWIMIWSLIGAFVGIYIRSFSRFLFSKLCMLTIIFSVTFYLFEKGWWIPVLPSGIAGLLSAVLITAYISYQEKNQKAILMQIFCSHVSKDIAESLWEQRDQFIESGRARPKKIIATVLFTDLQGFTSVSEKMDAQVLMEWLNEYMEAMVTVVKDNEGIVNKFIGDAIMAVFGVPIARTSEAEINRDAINAVNCAMGMGRELERLNMIWKEQNRPNVNMRVGIYTGPLVVGSLGSVHRQEYTVIGDTVNIASRLESFDKNLDAEKLCRILIGETTLQRLSGQFQTEKLTSVSLKGKNQKLTVYKVIGTQNSSKHN